MQIHKSVILYSGGMDSFVLGHLYPHAFKLYIDSGSPYAAKEIAHLPRDVHVVRGVLNLSAYERRDSIIPSRNAYFATIAANYGDVIMLGATAGDMSTDKDAHWARLTTALLRHMMSGEHFKPPRDISVTLPIKHLSKGELVEWYLQAGNDAAKLANVVSCYDARHTHCGVCKACMRKWLALEANDVPFDGWANNPLEADWAPVQAALDAGRWRSPAEDKYAYDVLNRWGVMP